jgi:hypothetical protein
VADACVLAFTRPTGEAASLAPGPPTETQGADSWFSPGC